MRNILGEAARKDLHGRLLGTVDFLDREDVKGREVLDIGCGYGWFCLVLLDFTAAGVIGVDVSSSDLVSARMGVEDDRAGFCVAVSGAIPLRASTLDTVTAWEVIEHIPKHGERAMLRDLHRVLKPGGVLYLSTPNRSMVSNIADPAWWVAGHRHYRPDGLRHLAAAEGFEIERCQVRGAWWSALAIVDMYVAKWLFRRRPFFAKFVDHRQDAEYLRDDGFYTLFMKLRKVP